MIDTEVKSFLASLMVVILLMAGVFFYFAYRTAEYENKLHLRWEHREQVKEHIRVKDTLFYQLTDSTYMRAGELNDSEERHYFGSIYVFDTVTLLKGNLPPNSRIIRLPKSVVK